MCGTVGGGACLVAGIFNGVVGGSSSVHIASMLALGMICCYDVLIIIIK